MLKIKIATKTLQQIVWIGYQEREMKLKTNKKTQKKDNIPILSK